MTRYEHVFEKYKSLREYYSFFKHSKTMLSLNKKEKLKYDMGLAIMKKRLNKYRKELKKL